MWVFMRVYVCVHTVHAWIYCIAVRKDNLKHKDNAHPSVLFLLLCSLPCLSRPLCVMRRRELWETSVLQLCIYWSCGLHTAHWLSHCCFLTMCDVAHCVARRLFSLQKKQSMKVCDLLPFYCTRRVDPVLTCAMLHLVIAGCVYKMMRFSFSLLFAKGEQWTANPLHIF